MRSTASSLTLIVPNIAPAVQDAIERGLARWPCLAQFAARGTLRSVERNSHRSMMDLSPWQGSLLEVLGLDADSHRYPSAAVTRAGAIRAVDSSYWAHLQLVHFAAGLSDVTACTLQGETALSTEDEADLMLALEEHLARGGYETMPGAPGSRLLRCPRQIEVATIAPQFAFSGSLQQALPAGQSGVQLRKLMTELQMLLHAHPVNVRRERGGLPAANAVWIWGVGTIDSERIIRAPSMPMAFGSQPFLEGVYLLNGAAVTAQSFDAETLFRDQAKGVRLAVVEARDLDSLETQWLAVCARALRDGSIGRLSLYLDRWRIQLQRAALLRFWRKPLAPMQWNT